MKALMIGIVVAALCWAGGAVLTPHPVTSTWFPPPTTPLSRATAPDADDVDAYGNEVASAVARYSRDAGGSLYELHAPQVDLPRPASPKS